MEKNRLAEILESSLKAEGAIQEPDSPTLPPAPKAPKSQNFNRVFQFNGSSKPAKNSSNVDSSQSVVPDPKVSNQAETPKFSSSQKTGGKNQFSLPINESNSKIVENSKKTNNFAKNDEDETPDILYEDEFEIDGMGEVWEYAGHSANVNLKEDSEVSDDEFDPNVVVKIQAKPKKSEEVVQQGEAVFLNVGGPEKTNQKKKRIDLKTRGMQAEAKIQQKEMKNLKIIEEETVKQIKNEEKVEVEHEWDSISIKEIEEVKQEKLDSQDDMLFFNRKLTSNQVIEIIDNFDVGKVTSPQKKSFFQGLFSCFRVKSQTSEFLSIQKKRLLQFSKENFDQNQNYQVSMLKKIFFVLTNKDNCSLTGNHWKEIGFTNDSPISDLGKVGLYGILTLFNFCEKYPRTAAEILNSSKIAKEKFSFVSIFLFFSDVSLTDLEENIFRKQIEAAQRVYEVTLEYFCGVVMNWFKFFRESNANFKDLNHSLEFTKLYARKHTLEIFQSVKNKF